MIIIFVIYYLAPPPPRHRAAGLRFFHVLGHDIGGLAPWRKGRGSAELLKLARIGEGGEVGGEMRLSHLVQKGCGTGAQDQEPSCTPGGAHARAPRAQPGDSKKALQPIGAVGSTCLRAHLREAAGAPGEDALEQCALACANTRA